MTTISFVVLVFVCNDCFLVDIDLFCEPTVLLFWTFQMDFKGRENLLPLLPAFNGFLRFISGATPADLAMASF